MGTGVKELLLETAESAPPRHSQKPLYLSPGPIPRPIHPTQFQHVHRTLLEVATLVCSNITPSFTTFCELLSKNKHSHALSLLQLSACLSCRTGDISGFVSRQSPPCPASSNILHPPGSLNQHTLGSSRILSQRNVLLNRCDKVDLSHEALVSP